METVACQCDGLPPHDHFMGSEVVDDVYQAVYDWEDVGRVWVDWRAVAKALTVTPGVVVSTPVDEPSPKESP